MFLPLLSYFTVANLQPTQTATHQTATLIGDPSQSHSQFLWYTVHKRMRTLFKTLGSQGADLGFCNREFIFGSARGVRVLGDPGVGVAILRVFRVRFRQCKRDRENKGSGGKSSRFSLRNLHAFR